MIKLKDLHFDSFNFYANNRGLHVRRYYNNGLEHCQLQLGLDKLPNGVPYFIASLTINKGTRTSEQTIELDLNMKVPKEFKEIGSSFDEPGYYKHGVDAKYMPFIKESIELYKEVNQDLFPKD